MTDTPPIATADDTKRLAALQALAQANLVRKAKDGKTLTVADWTELRRMMRDAGLSQVPWLHDTLTDLATALGISVRTLENWRPRGAPIPPAGPWDELAVRLWVFAEAAAGKRMGKLADPSPALAPYIILATKARAAKPVATERASGDRLKHRQAQMLDLKMAERQHLAQRQATETFLAVLGKLDQLFEREVGSTLSQRLWDLANGQTSAQALPVMQTLMLTAYRALRRRALG